MSTAITPAQKISNIQKTLTSEGPLAQIEAAIRQNMSKADRQKMALTFVRIALSTVQKNPRLAECSVASILASVVQSVQLGLEPDNISGLAYLVPFKGICTMIPGYMGLVQLMYRSGQVKSVNARAVYSQDVYDLDWSRTPPYKHKPCQSADRGELVATYMDVQLMTGGEVVTWMWRHEIDKIRLRSPAVKAGAHCPWDSDFEPMAIKTSVRKGSKLIPSSPTLQLAIAMDEKAEGMRDDNVDMIDADFSVADVPIEAPPSVAPSASKPKSKPKAEPKPPAEKPQPPDELPPEPMPETLVPFDAQIGMKSDTYKTVFEAFNTLSSSARTLVKKAHSIDMITDVAKMTSEQANNFLIAIKDAAPATKEGGGA